MDIDENTPISFQKKTINIKFPYMYEILFCGTYIWCFYNTTKIPRIFIIMDMFQHFCDVFVAHYNIAISNFH
jgi:hypothetical protein